MRKKEREILRRVLQSDELEFMSREEQEEFIRNSVLEYSIELLPVRYTFEVAGFMWKTIKEVGEYAT